MVDEHRDLVKQVSAVARDVTDVKVQVAAMNGKIDALTARQTDIGEGFLSRIELSEKNSQQVALSLNERITTEVKRADERHEYIAKDIGAVEDRLVLRLNELEKDEIRPLKDEAEAMKAWRNKAIGWVAGASFVAGVSGGVIVKLWL